MATRFEPIIKNEKTEAARLQRQLPNFERERKRTVLGSISQAFDEVLFNSLRQWSIPSLRVALGLVFLWFGALKVAGASPVAELVRQTYWFLPFHPLFLGLGVCEMAIGCGLICKRALRSALMLLWLHMAGTLIALWLAPSIFFLKGNPLWLTAEGEFVVKNLVLITASFVIGSYELKLRSNDRHLQSLEHN